MRQLRIFQSIEATTNASVPENQTWRRNLYEPLVDLGHDVLLFPAAKARDAMLRNSVSARASFSEELLELFLEEHKKKPFDLFFSYFMDGMIDPLAIDEIRKAGVQTCNFSCNNVHQFELVDGLSPHFDYCLHAEKDVADKFTAVGANPVWWPMASNPKYFYPRQTPRDIRVSFVGANYGLRPQYVLFLLSNGVDVHVYGPGWIGGRRSMLKRYQLALKACLVFSPEASYRSSSGLAERDLRILVERRYPRNVHNPVSDEDLISLYSRSEISLGFLEVYDGHDPSKGVKQHLHLREFEAPMSGALYCTGYSDELAEMFEPDTEFISYQSESELLDKVSYYLTHPAEAEKIRMAGHSRALRDHTYQKRFKDLFCKVGLAG